MTQRQDDSNTGATPDEAALDFHRRYRGKMQTLPKCPVRGYRDFATLYTPGVAAPCKVIHADPNAAYEFTNRGNTVAIVSDGTRVLGLGDIGPEAGLPVMEGKALLFKYLGGVDAVPLCVRTRTADELVTLVKALEPSFGGINLEDISQPKCFRVLEALRDELEIPVWHDDQQGSATVVLAALTNALRVVGKSLDNVSIALIGMGAANVPTFRLLLRAGADPSRIVACDSVGVLHRDRADIERKQSEYREKWQVCTQTNGAEIRGGIAKALAGADVCVAFSRPGPDVIRPEWVAGMAPDSIVFACANPVPEILPADAKRAGARIVATGRSDFPNQVNNSLVFPAIFRGTLDVRARSISDEMALAAAHELAATAEETGLRDDRIVPTMGDWETYPRVAVATALEAARQGLATLERSPSELLQEARQTILQTRRAVEALDHAAAFGASPSS